MKNLLSFLLSPGRRNLVVVLFLSVSFGVILVGTRIIYTGSPLFLFLLWNIFLAGIPYVISTWLASRKELKSIALYLSTFIWLMFFPNAPYILTDLFHLEASRLMPSWYDLGLILFFAWTGLFLGYLSLEDMQRIYTEKYGQRFGWIFSSSALVLCAFGIYLGRFLRWNSWDIISNPFLLLADIGHRVIYPFEHGRTYGVTIIFSVFLILGYLMMHFMRYRTHEIQPVQHRR